MGQLHNLNFFLPRLSLLRPCSTIQQRWGSCHHGHESNIKFIFNLLHLCSPELAKNQVGKGTDNDLEVQLTFQWGPSSLKMARRTKVKRNQDS